MSGAPPRAVLFVCTSNSVRSPIAAALARRHLGDGRFESAGVDPRETDPFAVAVMAELGLDLTAARPRSFSQVDTTGFDVIVCLTEEAHRETMRCKVPDGTQIERWPVEDPTLERDLGRGREQILAAYRAVRDDIGARILARFGRSGS